MVFQSRFSVSPRGFLNGPGGLGGLEAKGRRLGAEKGRLHLTGVGESLSRLEFHGPADDLNHLGMNMTSDPVEAQRGPVVGPIGKSPESMR